VPRIHCVGRRTGTPKDKDEVNRRDVYECCLLLIDKARAKDRGCCRLLLIDEKRTKVDGAPLKIRRRAV
jgi:hypothetical protein